MASTFVWFRHDPRLNDNAVVATALRRKTPIVPVYVLDGGGEGDWQAGAASRSWLDKSPNPSSTTQRPAPKRSPRFDR